MTAASKYIKVLKDSQPPTPEKPWRVFLESDEDNFVCIYESHTEQDAEMIADTARDILKLIIEKEQWA